MIPFWLMMAWRELRSAWRHFLYFLGCIALGVGAVVGVSLFSTNVERAVLKEARGLLGGPGDSPFQTCRRGRLGRASESRRARDFAHTSE